jgi:DNA polymerase-3 subunit delta'
MYIIGHEKERELLLRIAKSDSPLQSYIFSGPDRVGKFLVAEEFASLLTGGSVVDIRLVEPLQEEKNGVTKEKMIPVEMIRELRIFLSSYPARGRFRIGIIRDAHRLTEGAQNALLTTLEDPADSAILILITHEPGRILGTVRSRCQTVSFEPVPEEAISIGMRELFPDGTAVEPFFFSLGRPGLPIEAARDAKSFEKKKTLLRQLFRLGSLDRESRSSEREKKRFHCRTIGKKFPHTNTDGFLWHRLEGNSLTP